jgi:hypothetical protein
MGVVDEVLQLGVIGADPVSWSDLELFRSLLYGS